MAFLTVPANPGFPDVYQIEVLDRVKGGGGGTANLQATQLAERTGFLKKQIDDAVAGALTMMYANKLKTARTITMTGDGSWGVTFDGSGNVTGAMTLANSGVVAGTYRSLTVDAKGRVTAGANPTTLAGYGITDALLATSYTAADVLTKIKTVDGAASGLDADLLDGQEGSYYLAWGNLTGKPTTLAGYGITDAKQIQPIAAAVASNALTLTLNPTSLDFRANALNSGTVNSRSIGAAISLVVPSGATLGTVNATTARLVLLAIDNAGTVELAVANLAGGVNLDETTLISTTAISAAATSASMIYSTTARANVPFRVVGYIDITEATAGTWATAPSAVQGCGGNALSAMGSLGYGQTYQNVTGSRVSGTTYYNTTGRPIMVFFGGGTGNTTSITVNGTTIGTNIISSGGSPIIPFIVPPGSSYSASSTTINTWYELR
nr:hypothetical protein [uncultured Pseudogulbenkiania sp.]